MLVLVIFLIVILVIVFILFRNKPETNWTQWFRDRDSLPQSNIPVDQWYIKDWNNGWGPDAAHYPIPIGPSPDIITIARHYIGLPYQHHHIPGWNPNGLDCSNFTSWVYNYGKGRKFTSNVNKQAMMYQTELNMTRINNFNELQPGDLLYFWRNNKNDISHTGIFSGNNYLIDSHGIGVKERLITKNSWYFKHFSHAIRIIL
jgi:cell wall-associated NlpC family hydrolase